MKYLLFVFTILLTFALAAQSRWDVGVATALGFSGHYKNEVTTYSNTALGSSSTIDFTVTPQPIAYLGGWLQYEFSPRWALRSSAGVRHLQINNYTAVTTSSGGINTELRETLISRELEVALPLQFLRYFNAVDKSRRWYLGAGVEFNYLLAQWRTWESHFDDGVGGGSHWGGSSRLSLEEQNGYYYYTYEKPIRWRGMLQAEIGWQRDRASLSLLGAVAAWNGKRYAAREWDCPQCFNPPENGIIADVVSVPGIRSRRWRSLSLRLGYRLNK